MAAYVIVTPAHNEEDRLEHLSRCVLAQTVKPLVWIIVSDGSTDRTDEVARRLAAEVPWIRFLRREKPARDLKRIEKVSPGKVAAVEVALASVAGLAYEYFANLDADVTMEPTYYERVLRRFEEDRSLGIAGGMVRNILPDGAQARGGFKNPEAVGGPIQMFRRKCYEDIGGYKPYRHEDGLACADASRKGWTVVRSNAAIWICAGGHFIRPDGKVVQFNESAARAGLRAYFGLHRFIAPPAQSLTDPESDQMLLRG